MSISRTRFADDLVTEFLPPIDKRSRKVLILCHGMPSIPKKDDVMKFFSEQGYWVFFPRYRGTWESGGKFLKESPDQDVRLLIDGLEEPFTDFWTGKRYKVHPSTIHLLGSSFGGAAVLLAASDHRVDKVVAMSAVTDWRDDSSVEPLDWLGKFIRQAFGEAYRFEQKDWRKLKQGRFFNPMKKTEEIPGKKILLIHCKDDKLARYRAAKKFAGLTSSKLWTLPKGGHLSTSEVLKAKFARRILHFFEK